MAHSTTLGRTRSVAEMYGYRITKYNPELRDAHGRYAREEWTSVGDVGEFFGGVRFDLEEYERVEEKYLDALRIFMRNTSTMVMKVRDLELMREIGVETLPLDGAEVSAEDAIDVARNVLRENYWCKLEAGNRLHIHFGYDYYLYVETDVSYPQAVAEIRALGVFVEEGSRSPYGQR